MHIIDTNATGEFEKINNNKNKKNSNLCSCFSEVSVFREVFLSLKHSLHPNLCLLQNCTEFFAWFFVLFFQLKTTGGN